MNSKNLITVSKMFQSAQQTAKTNASGIADGEYNGNTFVIAYDGREFVTSITLKDGYSAVIPAIQTARAVRLIAGWSQVR